MFLRNRICSGGHTGSLAWLLGIAALGALLAVAPLGRAQTPKYDGKRVLEVQYDPPQQPLDPKDLELVQLVKPGAPLRSADIADTIDRMFATRRYEDIQVDAEPKGDGVVVRFITRNAWFVGHVEVSGKVSVPPNRGHIIDATQLELGTQFRDEALSEAQKSIEKLFVSNGLYEAHVHVEENRDPSIQQVNFKVQVQPGKRARYEAPNIRGDTKLSDNTIIRATGWRMRFIGRWRLVTETLTRKGVDGVRRKYQGQDRLTASVNLDSIDYDAQTRRAKASLSIDAGPKVKVKALEAKVSKRRLKRYVPIWEEGAVDRDLLVEGARNLRDYFQSQGYPDVDVTFRELPTQDDVKNIEYFISRGQRQKLAHLEIQGNKYFDTDTLRDLMILMPSSFRFRWGRYSEAFRKKDEEAIADMYKANGFRDVKVTSTVQNNYRGNANQLAVTFAIEEGPQWHVTGLQLNGIHQLDEKSIRSTLSSEAGQPYADVNVAVDRNAVLNYYYANGFPNATFQWSASPSGKPNEVELHYNIAEGNRQYVRDVLISGLRTTRRGVVDHNLAMKAGDPLSPMQVNEAEKPLYDLGIFAKIDAAIQNPDGEETRKYVLYDFEEANRYTVNFGFGAELGRLGGTSTDLTTPTGTVGFSPRVSLEVNRLNFLGLGHTVALRTRFSNLEQQGSVNYLIPRFAGVDGQTLTVSTLYDLSRDVRTFSSKREEASVQLSRKLSKPTTVYLRFAYRRVSTTDVVIPSLLVPQLLQPIRIGILSANWVQDRRDNPADAHKGIYNTVDIGLASHIFGSQRNFAHLLVRDATYHRILKNLVFARQTTFGTVAPFGVPAGFDASNYIPLAERFFGGGGISHRGFPENQAGPRDIGTPAGPGGIATQPTGFPLGGNTVLFNTLELRFPLLGENINGVVFHDAGNVYKSTGSISFRFHQRNLQDFDYMVHAVGFGIRYKTPVGPVRGDFAYSINPPSFLGFKGTIQQLLQCNPGLPQDQLPSFCRGVAQNVSHFQFFFSIGQTF